MENNGMDELIKKGLEGLRPEYDKASWDALAHKMDQLDVDALDDEVREGIEGLQPEYDPKSWDALASKITVVEDQWLDETVREGLEKVETPYDSNSWKVLLERLKAWEDLRREFFILRAAELVMVLLMLLAFYQYQPKIQHQSTASGEQVLPLAAVRDGSSGISDGDLDIVMHSPSIAKDSDLSSEQADGLHSENVRSKGKRNEANEVSNGSLTEAIYSDGVHVDAEDDTSDSVQEDQRSEDVEGEKAHVEFDGDKREHDASDSKYLMSSENPLIAHSSTSERVGILLPLTNIINESLTWHKMKMPLLIPTTSDILASSNKKIWLSLNSHSAVNQVVTPSEGDFDAQRVYTMSYGFGILAGFESGAFTWEVGGEYQLGLFKPKRTKLTGSLASGYRTTTLSGINVNYINIPLQGRYMVYGNDRHSFYVLAGIKLHISSKIDFDFIEEEDPDLGFPADFSHKEPEDILDVEPSRFTYFTLNTGFGYQYHINDRSRLFVQPNFEYFAEKQGIMNLNNEKVNSLRLDFGVRVGI